LILQGVPQLGASNHVEMAKNKSSFMSRGYLALARLSCTTIDKNNQKAINGDFNAAFVKN